LFGYFLAHPAKGELLPSLGIRRLLSIVCRPLTFHILIFSSETPQPYELKPCKALLNFMHFTIVKAMI
jgi:hypothetical protein